MKFFKIMMLFLAGAFVISGATAQVVPQAAANASINVLTANSGKVTNGQTVFLQVDVSNTGPNSIQAYRIKVQVAAPTALVSISNSKSVLPSGWKITSGGGSSGAINLSNGTDVIANGETRTIKIALKGIAVGASQTVSGQLSFSNGNAPGTAPGSLLGNSTADDNSTSTVSVLNALPTVSITSPTNGQTFTAPANIIVKASAADPDGSVKSVKFYNGTTYLKTVFASPYTYTLSNLPAGTYKLTSKATDNLGAETISAPVTVKVTSTSNQPPIVSLTSPVNGQTFTAPANIAVKASAADSDGYVYSVKFYNGTAYLKTVFASPYIYTLSNLPAGTYKLTAKATDNFGAETISAPVTVKVTASRPSIVSLTSPANGQTFTAPAERDKKADLSDILNMTLSPNPAKNILNISTTGLQLNKQSFISVISTSGVVVKTIVTGGSSQTIPLDISSLPAGVYIIKIASGDKVMNKQFVKL